jgi:hypothetical protein
MTQNLTILLMLASAAFFTSPAWANERFETDGKELTFNLTIPYPDDPNSTELIWRDVEEFQLYVMENPKLRLVSVSGPGGYGPAAVEIAETILEFGLSTRAFGDCMSACSRIFLAGQMRTLAEGARLGFHRPYIIGEEEREYFLAHRENRGWETEFDYVEWIYDIGWRDTLETIEFMTSRGVSLDFALEAFTYDSYEMWFPNFDALKKGGVLINE